jgi:tetratricopeptide (TPR) repeat protein
MLKLVNKKSLTVMKNINLYLFAILVAGLVACNSSSNQPTTPDKKEAVAPKNEFEEMESKLATDSSNIELRTLLATRYYSTGQLEKAAYHFIAIYDSDPNNLNALTNLGNIYYDNHQDAKAIEFYEKALPFDSSNINIRCDLATCYSNMNNYKAAIKILEKNCKIDPRHAKSHYNLSIMYNRIGDKKSAEKELKTYQQLTEGIK